jgi:hypothetical protein
LNPRPRIGYLGNGFQDPPAYGADLQVHRSWSTSPHGYPTDAGVLQGQSPGCVDEVSGPAAGEFAFVGGDRAVGVAGLGLQPEQLIEIAGEGRTVRLYLT